MLKVPQVLGENCAGAGKVKLFRNRVGRSSAGVFSTMLLPVDANVDKGGRRLTALLVLFFVVVYFTLFCCGRRERGWKGACSSCAEALTLTSRWVVRGRGGSGAKYQGRCR